MDDEKKSLSNIESYPGASIFFVKPEKPLIYQDYTYFDFKSLPFPCTMSF